jgi:hypothetical protein
MLLGDGLICHKLFNPDDGRTKPSISNGTLADRRPTLSILETDGEQQISIV